MDFHPTTTVNILRGETEDSYRDEAEASVPVASGVPAHITELRKLTTTPATGAARVIRYYMGRLPGTADVQNDDRIEDQRTGRAYLVDSASRSMSTLGAGDLRMDLRRVT